MDNPGLFQESNKRYSIWKRLFIYIIDGIFILGTFLGLFFGVCNFLIPMAANNEITQFNSWYQEICQEENIPYQENIYGIYRIDKDKYISILVENGSTEEKAFETYMTKVDDLDDKLAKFEGYSSTFNKFNAKYKLFVMGSICLSTIIFELLIPLLNRRHKTIAMMIFKSCLVDKNNIVCSNVKIFLRYLFLQLVELLAVYLLIGWIGIIFEVLVSFALISFTRNRVALHDLVLKIHMVDQKESYTE